MPRPTPSPGQAASRCPARRVPPAALALLAAVAGGAPTAARADPALPLPLVLQDDAELLNRPPARVREDLRRARDLGVGLVRLTASWSRIAPDPQAVRRPGPPFRPADPATYAPGAWDHLDLAVREAARAGLPVLIDVAFWAPRWAVARASSNPGRPRDAPDPEAFAAFARAVAVRYDGRFRPAGADAPLPRVTRFATWNEPNHPAFLAPQWRPGPDGAPQPASPAVYRRMHEAAARAIRDASPGAAILLGNLAAIGGPAGVDGVPPLRFLRELACVDDALRPRGDGDCADFRPPVADGLAYHPYTRYADPGTPASGRDRAALADLDALHGLLRRLVAEGRLRLGPGAPIWLTEYGYETREDDPYQPFTRADQARFAGWSTYLAWRTPGVVSSAQFLLRDIDPAESGLPVGDRRRYRDWQSGVYDHRGRPKPGAAATALPFWPRIVGRGPDRRLWLFLQVRPGAGARTFAIERWDGDDQRWRPVLLWPCGPARPGCGGPATGEPLVGGGRGPLPVRWGSDERTDPLGVAVRTGPALGRGPYRALWRRPDGGWTAGPPVPALAADAGG
ncbi:hypothetical protein [Patulibacter defluvii]|uniref:hypothetical protein n=1 Tax=Patulibacter defluvii TaxID=3095358 RepID=UPI002A74FC26|nr:hypothetical protein [Patulibacter sp. DM4]